MKKIVRLTESDLVKLVKRVIAEQSETEVMDATPISLKDMAPGEAIKMLADNGFLFTTTGGPVKNYESGLYKFVYNSNATMTGLLKRLVDNITKQLQSNKAQMVPASKGIGQSYIIDIITGAGDKYTQYVKGN